MQQTIFSFKNKDSSGYSEFIESNSNTIPYKTITNWPNVIWGVLPYNKTLIIRGPRLSGKTLLAKKWATQTNALFIEKSHQLTENILNHHKAFIIENLDNDWDEEKILHHFNTIHEHGKYLLITLTNIPSIKLQDLSSRISATNIIDITMPDDELIKILIFKLFSNYSVIINHDITNYLLKVLPREFPAIIENVEKINNYALEHKHKITIPLIKDALNT